MSREFLTWLALEVWYQLARMTFASQGSILSREVYLNLPVMPVMKPITAAEMFALGGEIIGVQVLGHIMPNRPAAAPNGRN